MSHRFGVLRGKTSESWALPLVLTMLPILAMFLVLSCGKGHNSLLNPQTNRSDLQSTPDTLSLGAPTADRTIHIQVSTGLLQVEHLAFTDSVESALYMRFGNLPDTVGIVYGLLGLRLVGGNGQNLRIDAYADSTSAWTETSIHWSNQPTLPNLPISTSGPISSPASGDTVFYDNVIRVPVLWIQAWKRNPTLGGLVLKFAPGSVGDLDVLSRDAIVDSSGIGVPNPRLRMWVNLNGLEEPDQTKDETPSQDAFVYLDKRPNDPGNDQILVVADWLPSRAVFRFDLRSLPHLLPRGVTINRALLQVTVNSVAQGDSFQLGATQALSPWSESSEPPDTVTSGTTSDLISIPADIQPDSNRITLNVGPLIQSELGDGPNGLLLLSDSLDVQLRAVGEAKESHRFTVFSRDIADATKRPKLTLVYSAPQKPRWNAQTSKGAK